MNCQRDILLKSYQLTALGVRAWSAGARYRADWLTFTPVEAIARSGKGLFGREGI